MNQLGQISISFNVDNIMPFQSRDMYKDNYLFRGSNWEDFMFFFHYDRKKATEEEKKEEAPAEEKAPAEEEKKEGEDDKSSVDSDDNYEEPKKEKPSKKTYLAVVSTDKNKTSFSSVGYDSELDEEEEE